MEYFVDKNISLLYRIIDKQIDRFAEDISIISTDLAIDIIEQKFKEWKSNEIKELGGIVTNIYKEYTLDSLSIKLKENDTYSLKIKELDSDIYLSVSKIIDLDIYNSLYILNNEDSSLLNIITNIISKSIHNIFIVIVPTIIIGICPIIFGLMLAGAPFLLAALLNISIYSLYVGGIKYLKKNSQDKIATFDVPLRFRKLTNCNISDLKKKAIKEYIRKDIISNESKLEITNNLSKITF